MSDTKVMAERLYRQDGCSNRSEFIERMIIVLQTKRPDTLQFSGGGSQNLPYVL